MVCYQFQNPNTLEIKDVYQEINDKHEYIEDGVVWQRIWSVNLATQGLKVDPFSKQQSLEKTKNPGTMGDIWDRARELSEMRAEKRDGIDPIKDKAEKDYSKKRGGISAPKNIKDLATVAIS